MIEVVPGSALSERLAKALGLARRESRVLAAMVLGTADSTTLRMAADVKTQGALRKHMTVLRGKLPVGGIQSCRRPTHYWLTEEALAECRRLCP
jgi:hypothetical protein